MNGAGKSMKCRGRHFLSTGSNLQTKNKVLLLDSFHGDHYTGLSEKFHHGTIYCSEITYRLATSYLGVKADLFQIIKIGATVKVEGVTVHAIDANHCPGHFNSYSRLGTERTYTLVTCGTTAV